MERPKLELTERSVDAPVGQAASTKPDIFGGAKPVDNADKLLKAQEERERKERLLREQKEGEWLVSQRKGQVLC